MHQQLDFPPHTASALPVVHDALVRVVPWVGWRTAQQGQRGTLACLLRLVSSRQEAQATAAVWVLWLLCAKVRDIDLLLDTPIDTKNMLMQHRYG